jgi:hypothetical protein
MGGCSGCTAAQGWPRAQMGHSNERNRYGEIASRATRGAETELVGTPEAAALRQRKINRQSVFAAATIPLADLTAAAAMPLCPEPARPAT